MYKEKMWDGEEGYGVEWTGSRPVARGVRNQ